MHDPRGYDYHVCVMLEPWLYIMCGHVLQYTSILFYLGRLESKKTHSMVSI